MRPLWLMLVLLVSCEAAKPELTPSEAGTERLLKLSAAAAERLEDKLYQGMSPQDVSAAIGLDAMDWFIGVWVASDREQNPYRWQAAGLWSLFHLEGDQLVAMVHFDDVKRIDGHVVLDMDWFHVESLLTAEAWADSGEKVARETMRPGRYAEAIEWVRQVAARD